jgi:ABC-2 type transport system permease protein
LDFGPGKEGALIDTNVGSLSPAPRRESAWRENLRTFRIASWLGWQVEGNWADPLVFFIFAVLRPVASALIILVMYQVIAGSQREGFFSYLYVSNAFFVLVIQSMAGMAWVILDDREHYRMLKYIYTSPARKLAYLLGRAVSKVAIGLLTTFILLATGFFFLGLKLDLGRVEWGWLLSYFLLGLVILLSLGLVLAGVALVVARHGEFIGEVTAGCLLLFSGAYFPVDGLPDTLRGVSLGNPVTYWLEGMRRALTGGVLSGPRADAAGSVTIEPISPMLATFDNWQLLLIIGGAAAISASVSYLFYRWVEREAKERGMIDRVSNY